jgi:Mn2+/Fe2+ NRAMP family transporter
VGKPVNLLIFAGAVNGLILPVALGAVLLGAHRRDIVGDYRHPLWLTALGGIMVCFTAWLGISSFSKIFDILK